MFKNVFWREETDEEVARKKLEEEQRKLQEAEYNPFEHRDVHKPTSDFGAGAHILKTSLGTGILAMPLAFRFAGLVLGTIGTIIVGFISIHCMVLLVLNAQELCRRNRIPALNYSQTARLAFEGGPERYRKCGKCVGHLITIQLIASFVLGNSVYVVFMCHGMHQIVHHFFNIHIDVRLIALSLWIPLILMCMLPNLKSLVPFSVIANLFVMISFIITMYYIFRDIDSLQSVTLVSHFSLWPLFLSTVVFALEGIGTVLPIENEMKNPQHFAGRRCGVVHISMSIVVTMYTIVGFFGYLEYGESTKGSITLNLPIDDLAARLVKALITFAIFFTYALQFYVPITLILGMIRGRVNESRFVYYSLGVRIGLVSLTILMAVLIPHLEPIIALVGSACFSMLGLLYPALIDTLTFYPVYGKFKWRLMKNVSIMVLSIVTMLSGLYTSILTIIVIYRKRVEE